MTDIAAIDFYVVPTVRFHLLYCLIVFNEAHLRRILTSYFAYYHESRAHLSLGRNAPTPRRVEHPSEGKVIALALYMQVSCREVLRCLLEGLKGLHGPAAVVRVTGKSGISQARARPATSTATARSTLGTSLRLCWR